ncbi:PepSY-associated TM helix domain-containing protein, partial [Caulobacter sp. 17J65-9]|uniref:PepSY-associated TM helix domain-containing protein n=1 Tax=Caulobacter sp. 17J65-9 TaxID=2709382 RepID=UPI0013C6A589
GRARPVAETKLSPDQAAARAIESAQAGRADARVTRLGWPTEKSSDWTVRLTGAKAEVKVADADGAVSVDTPKGGTDGVARVMRQIHYGTDTGPIWQTIIFLGGIAPLLLGVTGVIMWLKNRGGRRAVEAARRGR